MNQVFISSDENSSSLVKLDLQYPSHLELDCRTQVLANSKLDAVYVRASSGCWAVGYSDQASPRQSADRNMLRSTIVFRRHSCVSETDCSSLGPLQNTSIHLSIYLSRDVATRRHLADIGLSQLANSNSEALACNRAGMILKNGWVNVT